MNSPRAGPDPLAGFAEDLNFDTASPEVASVVVPVVVGSNLPEDTASMRMAVYLGLFDLLADLAARRAPDAELARRTLEEALRQVGATEGPLRFALYNKRSKAEGDELISRMRGREIAITEQWMLPKLEAEIAAYRARVDGLRAALEALGDSR